MACDWRAGVLCVWVSAHVIRACHFGRETQGYRSGMGCAGVEAHVICQRGQRALGRHGLRAPHTGELAVDGAVRTQLLVLQEVADRQVHRQTHRQLAVGLAVAPLM
jgi:hypothetical protein